MADKQEAPSFIAVAQQIRDALNHVEAVAEKPEARQSDLLAQAVAHLRDGNLSLAQDAAFRACRRSLSLGRTTMVALGGGSAVTVDDIRADLYRLLAEAPPWMLDSML
ncbi:hypothetical protein [Reyranella sp.]|uniref:hypothetical protein n=1 Tax=Reyranella sp. TaxID=1929291 RepID=UPI0040357576